MKETFPNYYHNPYSDTDLDELWNNCTFIFDSSALLGLYEVPKNSAEVFIKILKSSKFKDRLWIPYQVGLEYQRNRLKTIIKNEINFDVSTKKDQLNNHSKKLKQFQKKIEDVSLLQSKYIEITEVKDLMAEITKNLEKLHRILRDYSPDYLNDTDEIREDIDGLFEGKVGNIIPNEKYDDLYKKAEKRFNDGIPPGFGDNSKNSNKKYGDYIIWNEIIEYAKSSKSSVILVNNDQEKNDWWLKQGKKPIGPLPELVEEFIRKTGLNFYMYTLNQFLKEGKNRKMASVPKETIKDFENIVVQTIPAEFRFETPLHAVSVESPTSMNFTDLYKNLEYLRRNVKDED